MPVNSSPFLRKVRIRACGILVENQRILLVKHLGLGIHGYFWSPPGGGLEFGEPVESAVCREFLEEVNLEVETEGFGSFHEHIDERFHALELFFRVRRISGEIKLGKEPEAGLEGPLLVDLRWFSQKELSKLPEGTCHRVCMQYLREAED
jgi:8-oxo-dGTP diphosphatase